ncbi:unnamed protein product [Rhizophagus irregularis]|nr:unnamed protein product [Rhizophagus irregularis]
MDGRSETGVKKILYQYLKNRKKNINSLKLDHDDPILSGIINTIHIKSNHNIIDKKVTDDDLYNFLDVTLQIKEFPFEEKRVVKWIDKIRNDGISLKRSIKSLIRDLPYVWRNDNYQKRSSLINDS